jgi:hypothetical protein
MTARAPIVLAFALLAVVAASSGQDAPPAPPAEMLAPPFTAQQIKAATKAGRSYRFRLEQKGQPVQIATMDFPAVTDTGCTMRQGVTDEKGVEVEPAQSREATWDELARHASFPKANTTVREVEVTVPAGTFACTLYEVTLDGGYVSRFYFAKELPGPPVKIEMVSRQAPGDVVEQSMVLIEHRPGA